MKKYAIIRDEKNIIRAVCSSCLAPNKKEVYWPPYTESSRMKTAVIDLEPKKSNSKFHPATFTKSNDDFVEAQKEFKFPNLDDLTYASDEEKLKSNRRMRNKKKVSSPEEFVSPYSSESTLKKKKTDASKASSSSKKEK